MTFFRSLLLLGLLVGPAASAASPEEEAQLAELERVRREVADQVQLAAYDLVDELVVQMRDDPVFEAPTPVVVAGVTVPVGQGTGLASLVENHLADVLLKNPTTNVRLVHCPSCTAVVVQSGPEATIVSRGMDNPSVLEELGGATGKHALFLDIEAEGAFLVLRARLTGLTADLPIVWSHTISTSSSTPALLRQPDGLKSAADARKEYLDALRDRGPIAVPLRLGIRSYAVPANGGIGTAPPPFLWLQSGIEVGATRGGAWTSSLTVGYSFIPQAYQGIMAETRINRLLTGRVRSQTRPDLYAFLGASAMTVWGPATGSFSREARTADQILNDANGDGPRTTFGALHLGLDLRIRSRIGMAVFLETMPTFSNSENFGSFLRVVGVEAQSFGTEVTFWF